MSKREVPELVEVWYFGVAASFLDDQLQEGRGPWAGVRAWHGFWGGFVGWWGWGWMGFWYSFFCGGAGGGAGVGGGEGGLKGKLQGSQKRVALF